MKSLEAKRGAQATPPPLAYGPAVFLLLSLRTCIRQLVIEAFAIYFP